MIDQQLNMFPEQGFQPGMIAVLRSKERIAIWPCEGDDARCFTGQLLRSGVSYAQAAGPNLSVLWLRSSVSGIEPPCAEDHELSLIDLRVYAKSMSTDAE